jgi:hypothetical protein
MENLVHAQKYDFAGTQQQQSLLLESSAASSVAERAVQRRRMLTPAQKLKYNAAAAERMQRMRDRRKHLCEQQDVLRVLISSAARISSSLLNLARTISSSLNPLFPSQMNAMPPSYLQLSDAPSSMLGMPVPGYELRRGDTTVTFLNYDGMFAGAIPKCQEATAVIDTTGCGDLHKATLLAIKDGFLPGVNRLFLMRPTEGYVKFHSTLTPYQTL